MCSDKLVAFTFYDKKIKSKYFFLCVLSCSAHEARPQRNNHNNSGSETAANVLRSINNSFNIPNSQLNTIHNVSTGHFG